LIKKRLAALAFAALALVLVAGCGSGSSDTNSTDGNGQVAATDCTPQGLNTYKSGVLTVATDSPAYPPYFEDDDPGNGRGFESAVAYAIAGELGFTDSQVEWTKVPFNASYAPGQKHFDFDLNQISITQAREKAVTFSTPYYTANQAVLVAKGSDLKDVTSLAQLKDVQLGVQIGTTSLDAVKTVIDPATDPKVFDNSNDVVTALKQGQVDAVVLDLPTAIYLRDAELPGSRVVGQFEAEGGDQWGALMAKDSPVAACVNKAIDSLAASGRLQEITDKWMSESASAPKLD